jgi:phospholipid/cholesterol/gamma-HCH transport system permease protein
VTREVLVRQILFTGVEALPFTFLIATLLGASVVVQAQRALVETGQAGLLAKLLVAVMRELGPLVAGLILIGRSATAIVVELANMTVSGEIEALDAAGIDPFEYLVVPRVAGMVAAFFCVSLFFVASALLVGLAAGQLFFPDAGGIFETTRALGRQLQVADIVAFVAKTIVPGLAIAALACREGLRAGPGITDVPRAATRGTVGAIQALFVWQVVVSVLVFLA